MIVTTVAGRWTREGSGFPPLGSGGYRRPLLKSIVLGTADRFNSPQKNSTDRFLVVRQSKLDFNFNTVAFGARLAAYRLP